jgi:DNA ligase-associated metallophosphoesterase
MQSVEVAGQTLVARADRALFWPARKTLFLADLHLGKGAAFRSEGRPVPEGSTAETLSRLDHAIGETEPERVILLGDLWHSKSGRDAGTQQRFEGWLEAHRGIEIVLIIGNHDARSGELSQGHLRVEEECWFEAPFVYAHHPQEDSQGYVLSGHLHPAATVRGRGRQSYSLPCFWFRDKYAVLPSFGALTGSMEVTCTRGDRVLVICDGKVLPV